MITAAITAAIGAVLALFGVKPGAYLVVVAAVVKVVIVAGTVLVGARWVRRRNGHVAAAGAPGELDKGAPARAGAASSEPPPPSPPPSHRAPDA